MYLNFWSVVIIILVTEWIIEGSKGTRGPKSWIWFWFALTCLKIELWWWEDQLWVKDKTRESGNIVGRSLGHMLKQTCLLMLLWIKDILMYFLFKFKFRRTKGIFFLNNTWNWSPKTDLILVLKIVFYTVKYCLFDVAKDGFIHFFYIN